MSTRMCIISCAELIKGYESGKKITATLLAEKYKLNIRTLNPSLNKMTHAGLLKSQVGGVDRGYILARHPKEISIYDIVEAVEGLSYMKNCKEALHGANCENGDCEDCWLHKASMKVTDFAREEFKKVSIHDLYTSNSNLLQEFMTKAEIKDEA